MTSPPWNLHDSLVRAVFGAPDNMAAELRAVLPSELCAELDFESLQHRPGHFVDPDMRHAETDLLFSVQMGAERALVYVLVEHQSGSEVGLHFADLQDDEVDEVVDTQRSALMVYIGTVVGEEPTRRFVRQQGGPQLEEAVVNDFQKALEAKWNEGRAEGEARALLNLLQLKFRSVPPEVEARILAATMHERDVWMARVLTARTLDGVFAD